MNKKAGHGHGSTGRDHPVSLAFVEGQWLIWTDSLESRTDAVAYSEAFLNAGSQIWELLQRRDRGQARRIGDGGSQLRFQFSKNVWLHQEIVQCNREPPSGCQGARDYGYLTILPETSWGFHVLGQIAVQDLVENRALWVVLIGLGTTVVLNLVDLLDDVL